MSTLMLLLCIFRPFSFRKMKIHGFMQLFENLIFVEFPCFLFYYYYYYHCYCFFFFVLVCFTYCFLTIVLQLSFKVCFIFFKYSPFCMLQIPLICIFVLSILSDFNFTVPLYVSAFSYVIFRFSMVVYSDFVLQRFPLAFVLSEIPASLRHDFH